MLDHAAIYIEGAYAATGVVFAWMILDTVLRARRWRRKVEALEKERRP